MADNKTDTTRVTITCYALFFSLLAVAIVCTEAVGFIHSVVMLIGFIALCCAGMALGFALGAKHVSEK
jgi:hypothetical protein